MKMYATILLVVVASAIGGFLFWKFLRKEARAPVLVGVHLLVGLACVETTAMLLHGTPDGTRAQYTSYTSAMMIALGAAILTGLLSPLIAKQSRQGGTALLYGHVGVATLGLGLMLWWATKI
jgi:hypothetical protein